jgi:hypothetical protein
MPLIRYRTGDLGLLDPSPCKCGSVLRRLRVGCREANLAPLGNGQAISLEDLVEALFPLNYVASVAATAFAPPQTGLALAIGTNARATGKMASEIREALATMTRGNDGTISVKLVEGPATPAIGGAKPTVARPGRRPDAGGQAENAN